MGQTFHHWEGQPWKGEGHGGETEARSHPVPNTMKGGLDSTSPGSRAAREANMDRSKPHPTPSPGAHCPFLYSGTTGVGGSWLRHRSPGLTGAIPATGTFRCSHPWAGTRLLSKVGAVTEKMGSPLFACTPKWGPIWMDPIGAKNNENEGFAPSLPGPSTLVGNCSCWPDL